MERILIVSSSQKAAETFSSFLVSQSFSKPVCIRSGSEGRRLLVDNKFALILVAAPLTDEFGNEFAKAAAQSTAGVILVVRTDMTEAFSEKMRRDGVLVLPSAVNRSLFLGSVGAMLTVYHRLEAVAPQTEKLQNKIQEIRMVDRAKCLLIQYSGINEQQAHRYIEKEAMNRRITRGEVAKEVIASYEDPGELF
jgi:AmiR/NasT family two-component response regulator